MGFWTRLLRRPPAEEKPKGTALQMLSGTRGIGGHPPERGTAEFLKAYSTMPWLRAVSSKVANSCAIAEWQLFVQKDSETKRFTRNAKAQRAPQPQREKIVKGLLDAGDLIEITDHPLLDLLATANPLMTGLAARKVTQVYLDLVGEAFWLKERNRAGMPIRIWPLPPSWVRNTPAPGKPIFEISHQQFHAEVPASELLWWSEPNPENPYSRGTGITRSLADELDTDEFAAKHVKSWFYNSARPDIIVSANNLRNEEVSRLEQAWLDKHQGFWKQFKPFFINRQVEVQTLSQTFDQMQLVALREYERNTIIQCFGVPPELLGIVTNSNRATIAAADFLYSKWVVVPRLEFQRSILQEFLVPEFDERLIIDYASPMAEDREFTLQAMKASPWAYKANEWRRLAGALPIDDGDVHMVPTNLTPVEDLDGEDLPPRTNTPGGFGQPARDDDERPKPAEGEEEDDEGRPKRVKLVRRLDGNVEKSFEIQSLIFPKAKWDSAADARKWCRDHGFKSSKLDETETSYRFRQRDPGDFQRMRIICLAPGRDTPMEDCRVKAVGGPTRASVVPSDKAPSLITDE